MPPESLQVNVADPADRTPAARLEAMQQPFALPLFVQLLLNGGEHPRVNPLHLALGTPGDGILQRGSRPMQRLDGLGNHPPLLRKLMPQPGTDFGQCPLLVSKSEQVATSRDPVIEPVLFPLQGPRSTAFEQFRVNGTSKQMQTEFGNLGANE